MIKKVFVLLFTFFAAVSLFSCKKTESPDEYVKNISTLKSSLATKSESAIWTEELEKDLLTSNLHAYPGIKPNVKLSAELMAVAGESEKIYPLLEKFGSLDIESLSERSLKLSKDFADCLCSDLYSAEEFIASDSIFTFVFFIDDLKKNFFHKSDSGEDTELKFDHYVLGASFLSGSEVQVPLRLYEKKENNRSVDIYIFIDESAGRIKQIRITRMK